MAEMFRFDAADAHLKNPHRRRDSRRAPGNVPYIVDNLWEWRRPQGIPNRRHGVFASPTPALAKKAGGSHNGRVFRVDAPGANIVQILQCDAREHPDVDGLGKLTKLLIDLLTPEWVSDSVEKKAPIAPLWAPCLSASEVEQLFSLPPLAAFRDKVWAAISFWESARRVGPGNPWPFPKGEIVFEAESWDLIPVEP